MVYNKRIDGRGFDDLRDIEAKAGVIKNADGSAFFRMGKTSAYAAVYGPREMFPKFLQDPKKGILRCNYNMMPFSGGGGDRVKPGTNRRAKEISYVTDKSLSPIVDLHDCPNAVVDVYIELPQTDAGSRCCGINAAAIALADAGIPMKDLVAAVAVGKADGRIIVDLNYEEEHLGDFIAVEDHHVADIPVAIVPSTGEITLLQMDGIISKADFMDALSHAKEAITKISLIQKQALRDRFQHIDED